MPTEMLPICKVQQKFHCHLLFALLTHDRLSYQILNCFSWRRWPKPSSVAQTAFPRVMYVDRDGVQVAPNQNLAPRGAKFWGRSHFCGDSLGLTCLYKYSKRDIKLFTPKGKIGFFDLSKSESKTTQCNNKDTAYDTSVTYQVRWWELLWLLCISKQFGMRRGAASVKQLIGAYSCFKRVCLQHCMTVVVSWHGNTALGQYLFFVFY